MSLKDSLINVVSPAARATLWTNFQILANAIDALITRIDNAISGSTTLSEVVDARLEIRGETNSVLKNRLDKIANLLGLYLPLSVNATLTHVQNGVIFVTTGSSDKTITLPVATSTLIDNFVIIKADSGSGKVIVATQSSQTINGVSVYNITQQYGSAILFSTGTNWLIESSTEDIKLVDNKIGALSSLTTTIKTSIVNAINELVTNIGLLTSLTTTVKTSIVNAINELVTKIGSLSSLLTTAKDSVINAVNEVDTKSTIDFMSRQAIINGNFDIAQRGTSFLNPISGAYTLDRYRTFFSVDGGVFPNITISQQNITSGDIKNSFKNLRFAFDGAGSSLGNGCYYLISQLIENGTRYLASNNEKITVSFLAKSTINGKRIGVKGIQRYGTGGTPSSVNDLAGATVFVLSTVWQKFTTTFTLATLSGKTFGTNNDDSIEIDFGMVWGSTIAPVFNTGTSENFIGAGNIDIAQLQICSGSLALPFQPKTFDDELFKCKRYYRLGTYQWYGYGSASSSVGNRILFDVPMRLTSPTITQTNVGAINCSSTTNKSSVSADGFFSYRVVTALGAVAFEESYVADAEL